MEDVVAFFAFGKIIMLCHSIPARIRDHDTCSYC
jgi:hypothetical protein